jgi:CIC family chloride channel protein
VTGLVGAVFRLALDRADHCRDVLVAWAHRWGIAGLALVTAVCAVATAVAARMVPRLSPHASGSGIPHVEAVLSGELPPAPVRLVPVKFAGGVLAIGSGPALGREGPSVQMGASLAHLVGVAFRRDRPHPVGGGQEVAQRTPAPGGTLAPLPLVFLPRWGLAFASYAAGTPGGLLAPMLVLGARFGLLFGLCCRLTFPGLGVQPAAFAVVGLAVFFTGVVRAPVTGIVLVMEMTASFPHTCHNSRASRDNAGQDNAGTMPRTITVPTWPGSCRPGGPPLAAPRSNRITTP